MASGSQRDSSNDSGSTTTSSSTHRAPVVKALSGRRSVDDAAGISRDGEAAAPGAASLDRITAVSGMVTVVDAFWKTTDARTVY